MNATVIETYGRVMVTPKTLLPPLTTIYIPSSGSASIWVQPSSGEPISWSGTPTANTDGVEADYCTDCDPCQLQAFPLACIRVTRLQITSVW
jgi:hypothetical protein